MAGGDLRGRGSAVRKLLLLVLLAAGLGWVAVPGGIRFDRSPPLSHLGDAALSGLDGGAVSLVALAAGKPLVVNLWATWCPPCRLEMPLLAAAQRQETGVAFAFANQGEDIFTVQRHLENDGLVLANVLLDPGKSMGEKAGSMALPTTLFYDAGGRLVASHQGALSAESLASRLRHLRAAAPAPSASAP